MIRKLTRVNPLRSVAALMLAAACFTTSTVPVAAGDLNQVVSADEAIAPAGELIEFRSGHADIGPLMAPKKDASDVPFSTYIRDDSSAPPVWRSPEDVLFVVGDNAKQTLPESEDFAFTGAAPGSSVWVVPQVEQVGVPWVGWNTQSPAFVEAITGGITMSFIGHSGPGQFTLFLQNGGFEKPQLLWTSADKTAQDIYVDANTHTHANWVFTEPGIHQVAVKITAELKDGGVKEDTEILSFAVGEEADLPAAQAVTWDGDFLAKGDDSGVAAVGTVDRAGENQAVLWAIIAIVAVLVIGSIIVVIRGLGRPRGEK